MILLSLEVVLGLLSGFKTEVMYPIIMLGVCYYAVTKRVPVTIVFAAFVVAYFAYAVIEPFRAQRYSDPSFETSRPRSGL